MEQQTFQMGATDTEATIQVLPQYKWITVFNNTNYAVLLYAGTLAPTLSNQFGQVTQFMNMPIPLPPGTNKIKIAWAAGTGLKNLVVVLSDGPLPVGMPITPPGGNSTVTVTNTPDVNVTDRLARMLGHTQIDSMPAADITDRIARLLGHVIIDSLPAADLIDRAARLLGHVTVDNFFLPGWQSTTVGGGIGATISIKGAVAGAVAMIAPQAGVSVDVMNGGGAVWQAETAVRDFGSHPIDCPAGPGIRFAAAGTCWVIYR